MLDPEHALVDKIISPEKVNEVNEYLKNIKNISDIDRTNDAGKCVNYINFKANVITTYLKNNSPLTCFRIKVNFFSEQLVLVRAPVSTGAFFLNIIVSK